jgi:hypothetical protein
MKLNYVSSGHLNRDTIHLASQIDVMMGLIT